MPFSAARHLSHNVAPFLSYVFFDGAHLCRISDERFLARSCTRSRLVSCCLQVSRKLWTSSWCFSSASRWVCCVSVVHFKYFFLSTTDSHQSTAKVHLEKLLAALHWELDSIASDSSRRSRFLHKDTLANMDLSRWKRIAHQLDQARAFVSIVKQRLMTQMLRKLHKKQMKKTQATNQQQKQ